MKWFWAVLRVIWRRVTLQDRFRGEMPSRADDFGTLAGFMKRRSVGFALLAAILGVGRLQRLRQHLSESLPVRQSISWHPLTPAQAARISLSPSPAPAGVSSHKTVVQWNGKTIPTTYVSATTVTATVAAALIAKPGTIFVNTLNPFSGTGKQRPVQHADVYRQSRRQSGSGDHFDLTEQRRGRRARPLLSLSTAAISFRPPIHRAARKFAGISDPRKRRFRSSPSALRRFRPPWTPVCSLTPPRNRCPRS